MRRILVTGANKGIGFGIARRIVAEHDDTHVVIGARNEERGQRAVDELETEYPGRASLLVIDVTSDESVSSAAARVADQFGRQPAPLYAVVNNAGIGLGDSDLRQVLDVNTLGVHRVCEAFLPLIDPESGRIVNITSASGPNFVATCSPDRQPEFMDGSIGWEGVRKLHDEALAIAAGPDSFSDHGLGSGDAYGLSKALSNAYTLVLAAEHPNLRVNACTPGFIETDLTRPAAAKRGKTPAEMGMKTPHEGARAPLFLLFGELEENGRYYGSDAVRSPLHRYRSPGDPPYAGD